MCGSALRQLGIKEVGWRRHFYSQYPNGTSYSKASLLSRYILAVVMNVLAEMARSYRCITLPILVILLMKPFKAISEMNLL